MLFNCKQLVIKRYPVNICLIEFNYLMKSRGRITESREPNLKLIFGSSVNIYN